MSVDLKVGIDSKYWQREFQKGRKIAQREMDKMGGLNVKINEKGFRQPLGRITGDLKQFDSALAASNARVIAFGASTAVIGGISKAFKELAKTTVEVGKAFADINRILGMSSKGLEQFGNQLFQISKKNATAFQDTTKAALEFARQGLQTEETLKRTSDALTLVRLTGINADKAVSSLTATVNAFDNAMVTTTSSVNKFVAVETKFAVGARDLVEAIGRVGSSAKDAKVGFDELNAIVTSVQQTTGRGGAVIGNAMKTIFTRLQRQSTLDALESYNIAVRDIQGATLPAIQILDNFAQSYKGLSDSSQAYLREQVAGVFQANILSAVLKDLGKQQSTFSSALKVSKNATNEANLATEELNKTLSALVTQTGLEFQRLQQNIGKATFEPIAKGLLEPLKGFLKDINDVIDGEGAGSEIANGLLKGIRNVIGGPGIIAIVGLLGKVFINTTSYLLKSLPALAGITTQTQKRAQLEEIIKNAMQTEAGLADQIAAEGGNAARQAGIFAQHAEAAKQDLDQQEKSISNIAAILMRMPKTNLNAVMGAAGGKGRGGRGASGFIPGIAGEAHDISRGVGGVSRSAKPVVIPNFAFGGGVRGTMIANTGEHIVPNFKGGGSAIFNPNMIAQYGMPAGAKPIRGAGGYVPNFVGGDVNRAITTLKGLTGRRLTDAEKIEGDKAAAVLGVPASLYPSAKKGSAKVALSRYEKDSEKRESQEAKMFDATSFADMLVPTRGHKSSKFLKFKSADKVEKYGAEGVIFNRRGIANNAKNQLSNLVKIDEVLDDSIVSAANTVISSIHPEFVKKIPVSERELQPFMSKEGAPGAIAALKGAFFEALIGRMVSDKNATPDGMTLDTVMSPAVKKLFVEGTKTSARFGDFKGSVSQGNDGKFAEQVLKNRGRAAGGYVPNFAALGAAVEREAAAGVPLGAIRIDRSSRLVTPNNPAGLAVTNTRDEPRGLRDIFNASKGYIPNFAAGFDLFSKSNIQGMGLKVIDQFGKEVDLAGRKLIALTQALNTHAGSVRAGTMDMKQFEASVTAAGADAKLSAGALKTLTTNAMGAAQSMMVGARAASGAGFAGGVAPGAAVPGAAGGGRLAGINRFMQGTGGMMTSMGLTMGLPMLGGALEQAGVGKTTTGALNAAGTGAALGMIVGPWGAAVGAAGGALYGFVDAVHSGSMSLDEIRKAADDQKRIMQEQTNAGEAYVKAQQDLITAGSTQELEDAQKRLAENFEKIKGTQLETAFAAAKGDVGQMQEAIKKFNAMMAAESTVLNFSARFGAFKGDQKKFRQRGFSTGIEFLEGTKAVDALTKEFIKNRDDIVKREMARGRPLDQIEARISQGITVAGRATDDELRRIAITQISRGRKMTTPDTLRTTDENLENLAMSAEFSPFFNLLSKASEESVKKLGDLLSQESLSGSKGLLRAFNQAKVEGELRKLEPFREIGDEALTALASTFKENKDIVKLIGGGENYVKIINFYKKANDANATLAAQADDASKKAQESLESFIRVKSGITRLSEAMGQMATAIKNVDKISKAFTAQTTDIMKASGQGFAANAFAQTQSDASFGRQFESLRATTFQGNAVKIADALRANRAVVSDADKKALKEASQIFSTDIEAGLAKFREFSAENIDGQEKITKLLNAVENEYKAQKTNIEIDQAITNAKLQLEDRRSKNIEREKILQDQIASSLNVRARIALQEDKARQLQTVRLQAELNDERNFRGGGIGSARTAGMIKRQNIEQRIANIEFRRQKAAALEENIAKAKEILVQRDVVNSNIALMDSTNELAAKVGELIFEMDKYNEIVKLGPPPTQLPPLSGPPSRAQAIKYQTVRDQTMEYNAKRDKILARSFSGGNRKSVLGVGSFNAAADAKAGQALGSKLQGLTTQKQVLDMLKKESDLIDQNAKNENRAYNTEEQALKRRIARLREEITLGSKRLNTEKEINDERRRLDNELALSLDKDAKSFKQQFGQGMLDLYEDTEYIYGRLGRDLPTAFRDGMVNAMEAALDKTENFGDALRGVAVDLLKMIRRASLTAAMNNFTNLLGMGGSSVFRNSGNNFQNGAFVPGTGSGDRVPAMLEPGEYVMNRKAVSGIGKSNLDKMNFGAFPRFANGGMMTLNESVKSDRMSGYFLASDNPELAEAREKAMEEYQKKQQKKAERKALKTQFLSTLMSVGISKGISAISGRIQEGQDAKKLEQMTAGTTNDAGESLALTRTGSFFKGYGVTGSDTALAAARSQKFLTANQISNLGLDVKPGQNVRFPKSMKRALHSEIDSRLDNFWEGFNSQNYMEMFGPTDKSFGRRGKRGGKISGGFINRDSVPAYMAGGEFVMNNRAVRKYGLGFMGRLNGGLIPTMQAGGMVGPQAAPLNNQTGANTNNISINVNVGGAGSSQDSDNTGNKNANEESNRDRATEGKELGERIRAAVLQVIQDEQRLGGSLSKTSRQG